MNTLIGSDSSTQGDGQSPFGASLRVWRRHRGLSQLDLSLKAGISSRHVSFLETGRSSPSRDMVHILQETLRVPLRERNRMLLAAGYAPAYSESDLDDNAMWQVKKAVRMLLDRHEPYPAYAMDGAWNLVDANATFTALLRRLLPGVGEEEKNILRLFLSPRLLRPFAVDWEPAARAVLLRAQRQLEAPEPTDELAAVLQEVRRYEGVEDLLRNPVDPSRFEVFIPVALRMGDTVARWMTTIITFGGVVDVTLDSLVIECFFPADPETEAYVESFSTATR